LRINSFAAWLVPDVALVGAVVALFYSVALFPGYQKFFLDSDAGWHIRAGERMVETGALPQTEPFSFTMQGAPWFAWEWGADVVIGTIHKGWGLSGVVFFYGAAIAIGVWLWFRLNWVVNGNFLLACLFAAPMISSTTLHWLARPHLLSWLFLLGAVTFAEKLRRDPRVTTFRILGVAVASCIWANVHGSFFFGAVIALVYALGIALGNYIWDTPRSEWRPFAVFAAISGAATFINPYGWNLHLHVVRYLTDSALLAKIGEFQSFDFHTGGAGSVMLVLALAALGGALALVQKDLPVFFLAALLIGAALHAARGLPIVALLVLPLANGVITKSLNSWQGLRLPVRRAIAQFLDYSDRLRLIDAGMGGLAWAPLVALLLFTFLNSHAIAAKTGFPSTDFPVAAASAVEGLPLDARILAPDKFGGYLIYRFNGQRKVFFDGRSDLYGADFLKQCGRLMQARPGWQKIAESFRFDDALLPNDYPLIPALQQAGWKPVYHDSVCTLLTRN
jgi:hypothetical protein